MDEGLGAAEIKDTIAALKEDTLLLRFAALERYLHLFKITSTDCYMHERNTNETKIAVTVNLDGNGQSSY